MDPALLVAVGVCTHLACIPTLKLDDESFHAAIRGLGGLLCPCPRLTL
jgi:Rieske Fe-S protein